MTVQSLKSECIRYGIPLLLRYRYLREYEVPFSTHTLCLDPQHFEVIVDGKPSAMFGVGFNEAEAFADFAKGLYLLLMGHRVPSDKPLHDVRIIGRSVYDMTCQEVIITPELVI